MLTIKNLTVKLAGKSILNRLSLTANDGEIVVVMGPNGAGKSTLAKAIMGLVKYKGEIWYTAKTGDETGEHADARAGGSPVRLTFSPDKIARLGIFLSFQEPPVIAGVTISDFLRAITSEGVPLADFYQSLSQNLKTVGLPEDYAERELNVGFSGGEKKKIEALQLLMLDPRLAIFDEIDSGLDVDAVRAIAKAIKTWHSPEKTAIIITHNSRLIKRLKPNRVMVLQSGKIAQTGSAELAEKVLREGFDEKG